MQEPQLRFLRRFQEQRLDLAPRAGPIAEVDEGRKEVGSHLVPARVLGEQLSVDGDLLLRSPPRAEDRALSEAGLDVVRTNREHFVESSLCVVDEAESEKRATDSNLRRQESRFELGGLSKEAQRERRYAPIQPCPRTVNDPVELLGAREKSSGLFRRGAGSFPEVRLESELAGELGEPSSLHERPPLTHYLLRDREREVARRQHDQSGSRARVPAEKSLNGLERDGVRVFKERIEESIARAERQAFRRWSRGVQSLAHRLDEGSRKRHERGRCHRVGERPVR